MFNRNIERYLAVGLGLFCLLQGYTAVLLLILVVELLFTRRAVRENKR